MIGPILDEPLVAFIAAWSGALFDLTIVCWLLFRRSRPYAYATLVVFHLTTGALFHIGIFPIVMIMSTLIFFAPQWPRHFLRRSETAVPASAPKPGVSAPARATLVVFAAVQIVLPLRHYAAPGNVRWNEDGYYLSWRVMLTDKAGFMEFLATDPISGRSWEVGPELVLADCQASHASTRPDLVHATALLIAEHYEDAAVADVEVRAVTWVSMNGQPTAELINSGVDLAAYDRGTLPEGTVLQLPEAPAKLR